MHYKSRAEMVSCVLSVHVSWAVSRAKNVIIARLITLPAPRAATRVRSDLSARAQ